MRGCSRSAMDDKITALQKRVDELEAARQKTDEAK